MVPADVARKMAHDRGYDLVEIAPQAKPPVCKILDYGKFRYELKKKKQKSSKKQHVQQLKEVRIRPKTEKNDVATKVNRARGFLAGGDKVLFSLRFRGRENAHREMGRIVLNRVKKGLEDIAKVERDIRLEGNRMSMTLMPRPIVKTKPKPKAKPAGEKDAKAEDAKGSEEKVQS